MATYTRQELVRDVLLELGVLDANEAPEAEDYVTTDDRCQQKLEELYEDGLIPFDLDAEIPGRYHISIVRIVAETLYGQYGVTARAQEFRANAEEGVRQLRRLRSKPVSGNPTPATYY